MMFFLNIYFTSNQATKATKIYKTIDKYNFYEEMENFQKYILDHYKQYEIEIKNSCFTYFKNKEQTDTYEEDVREIFESFKNNVNPQILSCSLNVFLQKYTKNLNDLKQSIEDLELWFIYDYKNICVYTMYAILIFLENNKTKNSILQFINKIKYVELYSSIRLYDFERKMASKVSCVEAYGELNPIHELMPKTENVNPDYNYIHIMLKKLNLYDFPPCLKLFIDDLNRANKGIVHFYDDLSQKCPLFDVFVDRLDFNNVSINCEFSHFFNYMYKEEEYELLENVLHQNIYDELKIRYPLIPKIQKVFSDFYIKRKELVNRITKEAANESNKYKNKNDSTTVKEKFNGFKLFSEEFFNKSNKLTLKYDSDLRQLLNEFINKIKDQSINELLNENMKIIINDKRKEAYNNLLKENFISFFKGIFMNPEFEDYYKEFTMLVNEEHKNKKCTEINTFLTRPKINYNIERKKNIIIQIISLFTDSEIKKKCLKDVENFIDNINIVVDMRLEILVNRSYTYVSIYTPDLEKQMIASVIAEKEFNISMKNFIENEIKQIGLPLSIDTLKVIGENSQSKQICDENTYSYIIAFILVSIPVLIGFLMLTVLKLN